MSVTRAFACGEWRWAMVLLLLLACVEGCAAPGARVQPSETRTASAGMESDVERFTRLRTEYADRADYYERCESGPSLREMVELAEASKWAEMLAKCEPWIAACPVDINARYLAAVALTESGRSSDADEHIRWYRGLVDSVLASGDGRTPQTAFVVISVPEEYAVLRALRLRPTRQALIADKIDEIDVESETGTTATLYFNPAAHFRRLERTFKIPDD